MSPPARWLELRARAAGGEPDDGRLAEALLELGGRAVQEDDGWLLTHVDPASDDARVGRAVDDPGPLADLLAGLAGLPSVELRAAWQDHEEWAELWKRGLAPRRVGRRFVVTPSWCVPETTPGDLVIVLDPGMAFGNAEHGTTRGCLRLLERTVRPGERILDVGAGSGVLAIAAALLGAAAVEAVEADPWAVGPAEVNVAANGVADVVRVRELRADVDMLGRAGSHDGVVANIEEGVLRELLPGFAHVVRPGGWLLLSGLLAGQLAPLVELAQRHGFRPIATDADGEWRSALFRR